MMEIIKYAKMAAEAWETFIKTGDKKQRVSKYFHLRPTNSGVTVATTLSDYEMRGITKIRDKEELLNILKKIDKNYEVLTSLNEDKKKEYMKNLHFLQRQKAKDEILEEKIQAAMINTMSNDKNLKEKLNAKNPIRFIASEFIFDQGKNRVDVVGYDEQDIYFFELKKGRTTAVKQVSEYVKYYSKEDKFTILRQILEAYPISSVKKIRRLIGVMVMEYAESSSGLEKWKKLAKSNGIRILFYKSSLMYEDIA
jgi:hypothetical protein